MYVTFVLLLLLLQEAVSNPLRNKANFVTVTCALLLATVPETLGFQESTPGHEHRQRTRRYVNDIFNDLGPYYVRRAYRMEPASFWKLCRMLHPWLVKRSTKKNHKNGAKNGLIPSPSRVSAAIRYFASGSPYDIALLHGISHTDVFRSVWNVMDAVNACPGLAFGYPSDYEKQKAIAEGFKSESKGVFNCCAGAIDGILVWIERPSKDHCQSAGCGPRKFFCSRKKKFGLNMQATYDSEKRFLDLYIKHPASTSDYLCFSSSPLHHKLETPGFLKPGLCLFGDNAYVNKQYMATPYKSVKDGPKDAYNYFHSNTRITIECAFGMLVNRWGIMRKAFSTKLSIAKITAMVRCLCRLHNFCVNERLDRKDNPVSPSEERQEDVAENLAQDAANILLNGGVRLVARPGNRRSPEGLLHGGEHFDDVSRSVRVTRRVLDEPLPRERLLSIVEDMDLCRPMPKPWLGEQDPCSLIIILVALVKTYAFT